MSWEDSRSKRLLVLQRQADSTGLGSTLSMTPNVVYCSAEADDHILSPSCQPWPPSSSQGPKCAES